LEETRSEVSVLHHSPLTDFLLTGHDDGSIRAWNVDTGSTVSLRGHTNTVLCLGVAARPKAGVMLLSTGFDGQVRWGRRARQGEGDGEMEWLRGSCEAAV
jgi:WD40 repeat protein